LVLALLRARDGLETEVELVNGRVVVVLNIAWGYDAGDNHAHVTTNVSPSVEAYEIDFFATTEIVAVRDPKSGERLYRSN
jgi:hypothetical protein